MNYTTVKLCIILPLEPTKCGRNTGSLYMHGEYTPGELQNNKNFITGGLHIQVVFRVGVTVSCCIQTAPRLGGVVVEYSPGM